MYSEGVSVVSRTDAVEATQPAASEPVVPPTSEASSCARVDAQCHAVQESFTEEQALSILDREFLVFDTAKQQDPGKADGLVSREDLEAVRDGAGYTSEQQAAAEYLLDHEASFDRVERAADDWGQGDADGLISREDVAAEVAAIGARRTSEERTRVETLEQSYDRISATAGDGETGLTRQALAEAAQALGLSEAERTAARDLAQDAEAFSRLDLDGDGRISHQETQIARYAPQLQFAPGEPYLSTDPRANAAGLEGVADGSVDLNAYLRGEGAGAPTFVRVREGEGGEMVIEYWFYRRYNDFRDVSLLIYDNYDHFDDSECVAVRFLDGEPLQVAYSQHGGGVWLPWSEAPKVDGQLVSYPGLGSGANSPYPGSDDSVPGPLNDVHGPAPGEATPSTHIVDGGYRLVLLDGSGFGQEDLLDPEGNRRPDGDANSGAYAPGADIWSDEDRRAEPLPERE